MTSPKMHTSSNLLLNNTKAHLTSSPTHYATHVMENSQSPPVNSLIQCSLCLGVYQDPRLLPCAHSFCLKCLRKQVETGSNSGRSTPPSCALCRRLWSVPTEGWYQLPRNTVAEQFIASLPAMEECAMAGDEGEHGRVENVCLDCWESLCSACSRVHRKTTLTRNHSVKLVSEVTQVDIDTRRNQQPTAMCTAHKSQELVLYCQECAVPVCTVCYAASHSKHGCVELTSADQTFIDTIRKSIAEGRAAEKKLQTRLLHIDKMLQSVDEQQRALLQDTKHKSTGVRSKLQSAYDCLIIELGKAEIKAIQDVNTRVEHEKNKLTQASHSSEEKLKRIHQFVASYEKYLPPHSSAAERALFVKQLRVTMDAIVKETSQHDSGKASHVTEVDRLTCDVTFSWKWREAIPSSAYMHAAIAITQLKSWYSAGILAYHGDKLLASCLLAPELHVYSTDGQHRRTISVPAKVKDAAWTSDGRIVCTTNDTNAVVVMTEAGDFVKETLMSSPWCLTVSKEGIIYLADYNNGAYLSLDGGLTWKHLFKPPDGWALWQVINVHSDHGDMFWALEDGAGSGGSRRLREYPASLAQPTDAITSSSHLGVNGGLTSRRGSNISNSENDKDLDLECSFLWGCSRLAYDGEGSIFFADCKNNVIHLFAANGGQRQKSLLSQADGINRPRGLTLDKERRLLYVGQSEGDVRVFTLGDGKKSYDLRVDF